MVKNTQYGETNPYPPSSGTLVAQPLDPHRVASTSNRKKQKKRTVNTDDARHM